MQPSATRKSLIGLVAVLSVALVAAVATNLVHPWSDSESGASSAWSVLPGLGSDIPPAATVSIVGGRAIFLGGTGASPDDRSPSRGASVDVHARTSRALAAPPIGNGLDYSVAQAVGNQIVLIGNPCVSHSEMSTGTCFKTSWVAALYSTISDTWTSLTAPPVSVGALVDAAGTVGTTAVFARRGTGELLGLDIDTRLWSSLSPALAPDDVAVCSLDGAPVALTNSYLVNGEEVPRPPAPVVVDGATSSPPDPVRVKPIISLYKDGAWRSRLAFDAQSSTPFELACGSSLIYVLVNSTLAEINAGSPVTTLRTLSVETGSVATPPPAPVAVDTDSWQNKAIVGDDLALISSLGNGNQMFQTKTQTWRTIPPLPSAFLEVPLDVLGSVDGAVLIRNRGNLSEPGGQLAVFNPNETGVQK